MMKTAPAVKMASAGYRPSVGQRWYTTLGIYLLFAVISALVLFPVLISVFTAFKTGPELMKSSPLALPESWQFNNLKTAFQTGNMLVGFRTTAILIVVSVFMNTILGSMTSYILNRFSFWAKKIIMGMFLVAMVIPFYTTEVSRFQIIKSLGLYDTIFAPLLIYAGTDLLQIFIFLQFIEKISSQLDESAMIDGASYVTIYRKIIFPLLLPASATLAIIKAVDIMNDMYIPYLYMPSKELHTLSTALMTFVGQRSSDFGQLSAAIVIVLIPTILIYLLMQKYIFAGIAEGAIKG